jgi:hypothetical protein
MQSRPCLTERIILILLLSYVLVIAECKIDAVLTKSPLACPHEKGNMSSGRKFALGDGSKISGVPAFRVFTDVDAGGEPPESGKEKRVGRPHVSKLNQTVTFTGGCRAIGAPCLQALQLNLVLRDMVLRTL